MEEITSEKEHVYIVCSSQLEYLAESSDAIPPSHGVTLSIPDVIVCGHQDLDSIRWIGFFFFFFLLSIFIIVEHLAVGSLRCPFDMVPVRSGL